MQLKKEKQFISKQALYTCIALFLAISIAQVIYKNNHREDCPRHAPACVFFPRK